MCHSVVLIVVLLQSHSCSGKILNYWSCIWLKIKPVWKCLAYYQHNVLYMVQPRSSLTHLTLHLACYGEKSPVNLSSEPCSVPFFFMTFLVVPLRFFTSPSCFHWLSTCSFPFDLRDLLQNCFASLVWGFLRVSLIKPLVLHRTVFRNRRLCHGAFTSSLNFFQFKRVVLKSYINPAKCSLPMFLTCFHCLLRYV